MTHRLVGKAFDGSLQLQVLFTKAMIGKEHDSVMAQAQGLVSIDLSPMQITYLTGIPSGNVHKLFKANGRSCRVGRRKTSLEGLFNSIELHLVSSVFAVTIERLMRLVPAPQLLSHHILSAVRTIRAHAPKQADKVDWERLVEAVMAVQTGALRLTTCSVCHTRHLESTGERAERRCPVCRLTECVTDVVKPSARTSVLGQPCFTPESSSPVPRRVGGMHERRMRLRAAVGPTD
ncbi:hypothetical protein [Rhodanobacter sp. FW106-PBR-LB-2-11]|uniref:hypothetical protein n=1 Tax=Rhodanobacter sp. FW106-PBR-LB-2-11 TaxID=1524463 RepID=UPI0034E4D23F